MEEWRGGSVGKTSLEEELDYKYSRFSQYRRDDHQERRASAGISHYERIGLQSSSVYERDNERSRYYLAPRELDSKYGREDNVETYFKRSSYAPVRVTASP